jgi:N utilization substance protein A
MKSDFYAAISQIASERGIPKEAIVEVMEKALATAYRRTLGPNPPPMEISVRLDPVTGMARVYAEKQVVDDVFDERFEIDLESAPHKRQSRSFFRESRRSSASISTASTWIARANW